MSLKAFQSYLSLEKNYSAHTLKAYSRDLNEFQKFCEEELDLEELGKVEYPLVRNWIAKLVGDGLSNRSINRKIAALTAYYKFLVKIEDITISPLARHKSLKVARKVEIPFSEKEMEGIMQEVTYSDDFDGTRDRLVIELLYTTGMRRAELINLRLTDIDIPARTVRVLGKRNKERIIPLIGSTLDLYKQYLDHRSSLLDGKQEDFVLLSKSGLKIYETLVYRIINRYFSEVSTKVKKSFC